METSELRTAVRERDGVSVIDLAGDLNSSAEGALNEAYTRATAGGAGAVVLNFEHADYINSTGIALIVGLLAQARDERDRSEGISGCRTTTARSSRSRGWPTS